MARQELKAQRRTVLGKKVSRLRREGFVPGIVYGPVVEGTVPVSVDRRDFAKFFQQNGYSTLFDIRWEDGHEAVFIREVQNDPLRDEPLHIDFFAPNLRKPVRAMIPLVLHNPVHTSEGVLTEARTVVEVEALPSDIPHQIDVDISSIERPGDALRVSDLVFPANVTAVTDPGELLVLMEAVYQEPEEVVEEAEAAEAPESEVVATESAASEPASEATEE